MQDTKRIWVWVGVAVVVIAVILAFIWKPSAQAPTKTTPPPVTYATAGQIVPQFPQQLIIGATSTVTSSYYIDYSSSTKQSTVVFNSTSSMQALYASYLEYFTDNKWTIANTVTEYPDSRGIQAATSSANVAVAIVAQGTNSQVTVVFVANGTQ